MPSKAVFLYGLFMGAAYRQVPFSSRTRQRAFLPDYALIVQTRATLTPKVGARAWGIVEDVTDPVGRTFRAFADQTRSDRRALAACLRGSRRLMTAEEAAEIDVPVLIAVGTRDEIAGSAAALGKIIPGAEVLDIPNRDHMRAVGDKVYKTGVADFLSRRH